ncbi:MAG TPA: phage holin family protein [Parapedobacter sp.]|uniref:phage holin family protein n=1 Tax=Parapedobacter sp. TaxID=1958893 RepID=UPI002BFB90B3|nr:phage holin family protein [Parapedobacter sp.]HWK57583.1 phage holin family protein [Parapedobacter sp.]
MEDKKFSINGVYQKSKEYIDTRFKLLKLRLVERSSRLIASLITDGVKGILAIFVIFYLSLALGFYLSELLGSSALGFLATGGIFVLLIILISAFENPLERFFMNLSIKRFLQKWNDEIDEDEEGKQN